MRTLSFPRQLVRMSRRSLSSPPSRDIKRPRLEGLIPDDYKNGLMLAPMVRSGARMTTSSLCLSSSHFRISSSHKAFRFETWRKAGLGPRDGR
jgi:hypothetical protein